MIWGDEIAYEGEAAKYRSVPWVYMLNIQPAMPWKVEFIHPGVGYVVFIAGNSMFKVLQPNFLVKGDVIE